MSRFQENFLEIRKNVNAIRVEKIFRKFFMRYLSFESIVVGYRYYRIRQGIDTIELVSILFPSLLRRHSKPLACPYFKTFREIPHNFIKTFSNLPRNGACFPKVLSTYLLLNHFFIIFQFLAKFIQNFDIVVLFFTLGSLGTAGSQP